MIESNYLQKNVIENPERPIATTPFTKTTTTWRAQQPGYQNTNQTEKSKQTKHRVIYLAYGPQLAVSCREPAFGQMCVGIFPSPLTDIHH